LPPATRIPDFYYTGLLDRYIRKRDVFLGCLRATGLSYTEPQGAYYVMLDISSLGFTSDNAALEWFVREVGVAGVPGSSFFREAEHRFIRFHFEKKEETLRAAGKPLETLTHRVPAGSAR
jgi:aspartate/methionine/tyrosine aminotransferase